MATVFRVERAALRAQGAGGGELPAYMGRLIKLIPAEALGLYQTLFGILSPPPEPASPYLPMLPVFGLLLVIFVRAWGSRDASGSWATVQWLAVAISAGSFLIWVLVSGHSILGHTLPDLRFGSALMVVWVFFLPYVYKGD